jgi:hypothetical protein
MSGFRKRRQPTLNGTQLDLGSSGFISALEARRQQAIQRAAAARKKREEEERKPFWQRGQRKNHERAGEKEEREQREEEFDRQAYVTRQIDEQLKHETDPAKRAALEETKKKLHAEQSRSKQQEMAGKLASSWWGDHDDESRTVLNADLDEFFGGDWQQTGFGQSDPQIIDQTGIIDSMTRLDDENLPAGVLSNIPADMLQMLQQDTGVELPPIGEMELLSLLWKHEVDKSLTTSIYTTITHQPEIFNALVFHTGSVEGALLALIPQLHWQSEEADLAGMAQHIADRLGITDVDEDLGRLLDYFTPGTGEIGVGPVWA